MAYRGKYGADSGGGYNDVGAVDTLIPGHYIAGGDVWGLKFTTNWGNEWWGCNAGIQGSFPHVRACYVSKRSATAGLGFFGTGILNNTASNGNGHLYGVDFGTYTATMIDANNGFGQKGFGKGAGNTASNTAKRPSGDMIDGIVVGGTEYIYTLTPNGIFRYTNAGANAAAVSGPTQLATPTDIAVTNCNFYTTIRVLDQDNLIAISYDRNGPGSTAFPAPQPVRVFLLQPTTGHLHTATGTSQITVTTLSHPVDHIYDLKRGKDGVLYAACGFDGVYSFSLSGTTPTWTLLYGGNDNVCSSVDAASDGKVWAGQAGGAADYSNSSTSMVRGHGAFRSNAAQTSWSYPPATGTIGSKEYQAGDGAVATGRTWWLRSQNIALDGPAYDCSIIRVDPFDDNRVTLFGRTGAWQTRDGGTNWNPIVRGFNGVESEAVRTYSSSPTRVISGNLTSGGNDDYDTIVSTDLLVTGTKGANGSTVPAGNGKALAASGSTTLVGDDGATYVFTAAGSSPAQITRNGTRIDDAAFRGAVVNSNYMAVSQNGTVFISQFGGGVFILDPGGAPPAQPPVVSSFTPTSTTVGSTVTVSGSHFTGATSARVNTTAVVTFSVLDDATISLVVPVGATTGPISITTSAGSGTSTSSLTVAGIPPPGAPTITSFTPTSGVAGDTVTVTGTNLGSATAVKIGGSAGTTVTPSSNTSTTIVFTIPAGVSSGKVYAQTAGGSVTSTQTLTVTVTPPSGGATITNLPQGAFSRTATMQVRAAWTTDAQARQVAQECVLISGPFSMPRLAAMMTTKPNLIVTPYLKSIQNPKSASSFDPNGTRYPAKWYTHLKDGTKAIQTGTFTNWVMESGFYAESHTSATVPGDLSGNSITAASWAEYHIKDSIANVNKVNAQAAQAGTTPFRGLWLDSMSTFSADNVTGFWGTANPGWNPHTAAAYTRNEFSNMAYYMGDMARGAVISGINPSNLWVVGNGLRQAAIADHVDMAMSEGWLVSSGATVPTYTQQSYEAKLQLVLDCQAKGCVAQLLEWGGSGDTAATNTQRRRFAAASYLIAHRGLATFEYGATKTTGPWLETGDDPDLYAVNFGQPLSAQSPVSASGHRVAVGSGNGQAASAGVYARLFDSGTVLVNYTGAAINYKASKSYTLVPNPGQAGASYVAGNLISIPAKSGVFLSTTTSGATAPANTDLPYVLNSPIEGTTLVRDPGNWTGSPAPTFSDQWQVSPDGSTGWADITGATGASFTIPFGTSGTSTTTIATDTFGRTLTGSWGTAPTGGAWTVQQGTSADFDVGTGVGTISHSGANTGKMITLPLNTADVDVYFDVHFPNAAAGGNLQDSVMVRFQDVNNFLDLNAVYSSATGDVSVSPRKVIAGTATTLGTAKPFTSFSIADNLHLRFTVTGSRIQGKAWEGAAAEPVAWDWDVTDSSLTAAGDVGARSFRGASNTNTSPQSHWDNLQVQTGTTTVTGYVGEYLRVRTTGTNSAGNATANSAAVGAITSGATAEPRWTTQPSVTGAPAEQSTLTGHAGTLTGTPTLAYQWQSSPDGAAGTWTNVSGATAITTTPPTGTAGDYYRLRVRATNTAGTVDSYTPRVGPITGGDTLPQFTTDPTVTGTPTSGEVLTADLGAASGSPVPTITGQWQRSTNAGASWTNIANATGTTYTLVSGDVGALIRMTATATNRAGNDQASSTAVGPVQYPNVFPDFALTVTVE